MANPFLFGEPAAAPQSTNEPPNPFLMDAGTMQPSAAVANPFMASAAMGAPMQQPQQGFYAAPMEAANPFASFGAPAPGMGFSAAPPAFGQAQPAPTAPLQAAQPPQQPQPHEPHQQQFQGQFGQYTQVMAESTAQPEVTPSVPQQVAKNNPFGDPAADSLPSPPPPVLAAAAEEKPCEKPSEIPDEPPLPPQPPNPVTQQASVEESLPPPPAPLAVGTVDDQEEVEKMEKVTIVAEPEPPTPPPEVVEESEVAVEDSTPAKEEGFSGIFTSDQTGKETNALSTEQPLAAAVSTSDIPKAASAAEVEPDTPSTPSPEEEQAPSSKVQTARFPQAYEQLQSSF